MEYLSEVYNFEFCNWDTFLTIYTQTQQSIFLDKEWSVKIDNEHSTPYLLVGVYSNPRRSRCGYSKPNCGGLAVAGTNSGPVNWPLVGALVYFIPTAAA